MSIGLNKANPPIRLILQEYLSTNKRNNQKDYLTDTHKDISLTIHQHNNIVVYIMIPACIDIGGAWNVLPPGVHEATLEEIEKRFAMSGHRKHLFTGLKKGIFALHEAGCRKIFLDGSFITEKPIPADFDVCWDPAGVDHTKLDPVFLDFSDGRKKQKERFHGEFFPANCLADGQRFFFDFFQIDKHTGNAKGIICIRFSKNLQERYNNDNK